MALTKEELFCTKYTKALGRAIAQKVEEGYCVKEICEQLKPRGFPNEKTIYRWKKKYPEFKEVLDRAYQDLIFKMMDEMNVLSKESISQDTDKNRKEAIKIRLKTLEFMLNKIAPKLVSDLKDVQQTAVPQNITVINYSKAPEKVVNNLLDHE